MLERQFLDVLHFAIIALGFRDVKRICTHGPGLCKLDGNDLVPKTRIIVPSILKNGDAELVFDAFRRRLSVAYGQPGNKSFCVDGLELWGTSVAEEILGPLGLTKVFDNSAGIIESAFLSALKGFDRVRFVREVWLGQGRNRWQKSSYSI